MPQPTISEAQVSPEFDWPRSARFSFDLPGGQAGSIELQAQFGLYSYRTDVLADPIRFLSVSLANTVVNPGSMRWNQDDKRGWFTARVLVEIGTGDADVTLVAATPQTTALNGSHSVSSTLDFSLSGGFFGPTPTATATVGGSFTKSWTADLTGFTVIKNTRDCDVEHQYHMAASQDGGPYDDADDYSLIETSVGGNWSDLLAGYTPGRLFHPPDVATSDLDIVSQALFQTIPNYTRSIDLGIFVTPYFTRVEKTFAGVSIIPKVEHFAPRDVGFLSEPIDFSRVA